MQPSLRSAETPQQEILVFAPHPDDETFGCGGTLKLLTEAGADVDVIYLTRGELGIEAGPAASSDARDRLAHVRMREAEAACKILGVRSLAFLEGRDGQLAPDPALEQRLYESIASSKYRRFFCPHPAERHPDHAATFTIFRRAVKRARVESEIWLYEIWTPLQPNTYVPIDTSMAHKIAAMRCHESQLDLLNYVAGFEGLAGYRALATPPARFAEAFFVCNSTAFW